VLVLDAVVGLRCGKGSLLLRTASFAALNCWCDMFSLQRDGLLAVPKREFRRKGEKWAESAPL
jgi:hypothetical protein